MSGSLKMTVNVSLCGCIPRSQMDFYSTKQELSELDMNSRPLTLRSTKNLVRRNGCKTPCLKKSTAENRMNLDVCLPRQVSCEEISVSSSITPSPPPIIEPPSWAVAAQGEARLEPVCDSIHLQTPVDLTKQAVFRVGRSQTSDVELLHFSSSRRHAILFHHPNGSCYVVDCGSAYGTYVNGVRVNTVMAPQQHQPQSEGNGSTGIIVPHKVKRGAIIRFGGPGAPTFILKSFSTGLKTLVENVKETKNISICRKSQNIDADPETCESDGSDASSEALVTLNTRLNALGSSVHSFSRKNLSPSLSLAHIHSRLQPQTTTQTSNISFLKKRSIVSFDESDSEVEVPPMKKLKSSCMTRSTHSTFDQFASPDIAIVSPSRQKPTLQFSFESIDSVDRRVVSPTPIEDVTTLTICDGINLPGGSAKGILRTPLSLPCTKRKTRRVHFSDTLAEVHNHLSVSIDESD